MSNNSTVDCAQFSTKNENILYTSGDQADIYVWDLRNQRRCLKVFKDDGNFQTTQITMSKDGDLLATGSRMGTINIFKID